MDLTELRRQHRDLAEIATRLAQAIAQRDRPDGVSALRWQLARQLMTHLALEDRILYPTMQRSGDEKARSTADRLLRETGALAQAFSTYMTAWSDERITRDWPGFRAETAAILKALGDRVRREDDSLYPLAERLSSPPARTARLG